MLKLLFLLCAMLSVVACVERDVQQPVEQNVRPARIYLVEDTARALQHTFVGRVEANQSVDVTFEVAGPLQSLPILEGQEVQKGGLVAALDPTDFELAVQEAQVQLQLAKQDLERKQQVLKQKSIARSVVDDASSVHELQKVRLSQAKQSLADSKIIAPFDAYIARRYVDNFVNVSANQKIARLNDLHTLKVVANVPEALLATVSQSQVIEAFAEFDFAPTQKFPLVFKESSGEADTVAQTYRVTMTMQRPQQVNILPGMTAKMTVLLRDPNAGDFIGVIPVSALVSDNQQGFAVWRYDPKTGVVQKQKVQVGDPQQNGVQILKGLNAGDQIVATGASQLQAGMKVTPLHPPHK